VSPARKNPDAAFALPTVSAGVIGLSASMKSRFPLAWLMVYVVLAISRLAAQDVIVTDPAWRDSESPAADALPQFTKRPKPDFPDELKNPEQIAYAIVWETIDENGKRVHSERVFSNPYLENATAAAMSVDQVKYAPAVRGGKAVMASCWFACIFNPHSASPKKNEATPRLLAVAPIVVRVKELPAGAKTPLVIWAKLSLDEKGQIQNYVFDDPAYEKLRPQVGGSLHLWRFAPARRNGLAVAAESHVPLILNQAYSPKTPGIPPKVLHRERAEYPRAMLNSRLRGEVLLEFVVDKNGLVKNPVVKQSNNPGFDEAAIEALTKWKFEPGSVGGEPVNAKMQLPIIFEFEGISGRDFATVEKASKKDQAKLPEELRYDIAPKPKGVLIPIYPYPLLHDKANGKAVLAFLVDADGRVANVKVVEATKPEFGLAMVAAVEAFNFLPAMKDGKPTVALLKMEQEFNFGGFRSSVSDDDLYLFAKETKHPEKIISAKKLDAPLKPISQRSPVFPYSVKSDFDRGSATIEILVDEEGKVRLPRITEATAPAFGYAAIQAVNDWRFEPPKANGKPAVVRAQVPFEFTLEAKSVKPAARATIDQATIDSIVPEEKQP